jgi:hypothetical protein
MYAPRSPQLSSRVGKPCPFCHVPRQKADRRFSAKRGHCRHPGALANAAEADIAQPLGEGGWQLERRAIMETKPMEQTRWPQLRRL